MVTTTISTERDSIFLEDVEAEGSWRSPSHATMNLRKPRAVASDSSVSDLEAGPALDSTATFTVDGVITKAHMTKSGLVLRPLGARRCWLLSLRVPSFLHYSEILAVSTSQHVPSWRRLCRCCVSAKVTHVLQLHTFHRRPLHHCHWTPVTLELHSHAEEVVRSWADDVADAVADCPGRPRTLLVLLNPWGGSGRARRVWERQAFPVLSQAGVRCVVVITERPRHALETLRDLPLPKLHLYDGVLAVGGDGLFQEVLDGVMAVRGSGDPARAAAAAQLRLGHIPAGSTDAVAYSLNGTRSAATAALHVALGDRTPLDVMRVDTGDGSTRCSVCYATYGYMGDLLRTSEALRWHRWLGERRYPLAGALTLLRGRRYRARVSYLPASPDGGPPKKRECRSQCQVCASACGAPVLDVFGYSAPADEGKWTTIEGEFKAVMAIVTPCRSDMSAAGLCRYAHLADGRLHLVLVRVCTVAQYLRFLALIPRMGVHVEHLPFVTVVEAAAVRLQPLGEQSAWNVDGELMADNRLSARVHRGAVDVFGRGVE